MMHSLIKFLKKLWKIKYLALLLLVAQNTSVVLLMGYSRNIKGPMYSSGSAVASCEVLKLFSCCFVIMFQQGGLMGLFNNIKEEIIDQPLELAKLAVPSLLYTLQNNLLFYALSNLNAATFQVGYQIKLLTTALFSVFMLGKSISQMQWLSLVILAAGVVIAQSSAQKDSNKNDNDKKNVILGFSAAVLAACLSGFAGVYFEKILKNSHTTLWMRNIQMSLSAIIISLFCIGLNDADWQIVSENGFFYGYSTVVWSVIFLQAVGGLLVAVVVKYADNILKGMIDKLIKHYYFHI